MRSKLRPCVAPSRCAFSRKSELIDAKAIGPADGHGGGHFQIALHRSAPHLDGDDRFDFVALILLDRDGGFAEEFLRIRLCAQHQRDQWKQEPHI